MMSSNRKKVIMFSIILSISIILLIVFTLVDINLGVVKFSSVKSLIQKHEDITNSENDLIKAETTYGTTLNKLETEKSNFETEKQKYNAITNETIDIVKNIKTEEKYSIEYMWIRLGNYARVNNLSIVLVEPGGSEITSTETNNSTSKTVSSDSTNEVINTTSNLMTPTTTNSTLFKIQVTGSYIDVSSFVFEVENDKELRFKLDNIVMEYVSGTTIKATFNVKNLVINK